MSGESGGSNGPAEMLARCHLVLRNGRKRPFLRNMSATQYRLIELAIVPRAGRLPADLAQLDSLSPMQHSFRAAGNLNMRMADHIGSLISETLTSKGAR